MNSTDDISKKMESMSLTRTTQRVVRRNKRVPIRNCPYSSLANDVIYNEKKEEVVRFGVKLSVFLAKTMFLYSDDIRCVLCFCFLLFKCIDNPKGDVGKRLVGVMEHVFAKYIKPKNGVYKDGGKMLQWEEITVFERCFTIGFRCLDFFALSILRNGETYFYQQCLPVITRRLESSLLASVNEANGFPKETTIESDILPLWKDLFQKTKPRRELSEDISEEASGVVEEALETTIPQLWKSLSEQPSQVIKQPRLTTYPGLFRPLIDECKRYNVCVRQLSSLSL